MCRSYGDVVPHTVAGRIIVMFAGIGFLAVFTATVASHFVQVDQQSESSQVLDALHRIEADSRRAEDTARRPASASLLRRP
jgi:hypothetical protein